MCGRVFEIPASISSRKQIQTMLGTMRHRILNIMHEDEEDDDDDHNNAADRLQAVMM